MVLPFHICLLLVPLSVLGYPDGAGKASCIHMIPEHDYIESQMTEFPFELLVDEVRPYIDDKVVFTIYPKSNTTKIAGFMVQVRDIEFISNPMGTFVPMEQVKVMDCLGKFNNTATHTNPNPKDFVNIVWYPPSGFQGNCTFYATVATSREVFWVSKPSQNILYRHKPE